LVRIKIRTVKSIRRVFVFRKDISGTNFKNFKKRDAFSKVFDFVTGDECRSGKILVLYGLSGTGKTAIMEQTLSEYPNPDECVMYEIEDGNDMEDIKYLLADMEKNKYRNGLHQHNGLFVIYRQAKGYG
jgi:Cdc6-like AAA superfamily ATPase